MDIDPSAQLIQAVEVLRRDASHADIFSPQFQERLLGWGARRIDAEFQANGLTSPIASIKRMQALSEWKKYVQSQGQLQRHIAVGIATDKLTYELQRVLDEMKFQDAERRRNQSLDADSGRRLKEHKEVAGFDSELRIREMEAAARIAQDTAPTRTDPMAVMRLINQEIAQIERDQSLSEDERHRRVQGLRDATPDIIRQYGGQ